MLTDYCVRTHCGPEWNLVRYTRLRYFGDIKGVARGYNATNSRIGDHRPRKERRRVLDGDGLNIVVDLRRKSEYVSDRTKAAVQLHSTA